MRRASSRGNWRRRPRASPVAARLVLEVPDPRLLIEGRQAVGRVAAAATSLEGIGLRVAQELGALVADLGGERERHLGDAVTPVQPVDDRGPDLAHDAALVDSPSGVELVLRPQQAAAAWVPGELGNHPAVLPGAGEPADRSRPEPGAVVISGESTLVEVRRLLQDGLQVAV